MTLKTTIRHPMFIRLECRSARTDQDWSARARDQTLHCNEDDAPDQARLLARKQPQMDGRRYEKNYVSIAGLHVAV